jgi:FKBP-type peptidyl-prolyl cis-trans isomerase (trigger factor)
LSAAETKDNCTREIEVEIPAEVVARETGAVIERFQKHAKLPGFRRGKVPASIVRQRFPDDIKSELVDTLVPRYYREEVEKRGLQPISQPRVSDLHLVEGEPLRFKATFEIMPEIEVSGYQELRAEQTDTSVSDQAARRLQRGGKPRTARRRFRPSLAGRHADGGREVRQRGQGRQVGHYG